MRQEYKKLIEDWAELKFKRPSSISQKVRIREKTKAFEDERKEFWKAVYIKATDFRGERQFKAGFYADEALNEFDKRFKK